jgi:hypothetical protein
MDWQLPLLISASVFGAFLVFKMRPAVTPGGRATVAALENAKRRIEAAKEDSAKGAALADAGDACAHLGRTNSAVGFYHRALRVDPRSVQIVERASTALARRPAALEGLMWRHLAAHPWSGEHRASAVAALRALSRVYGRRRRHHVRSEAIGHALAVLGEPEAGGRV